MGLRAKLMLSAAALALAAPGAAAAQLGGRARTGTVCVAPAAPLPEGVRSLATPTGERRARAFKVRIGGRPAVAVSSDSATRVGGLALGRRHLVRIYGDGKPFESFRFRFSDYSSRELCLWFKPLYETWSLSEAGDGGAKCRCR